MTALDQSAPLPWQHGVWERLRMQRSEGRLHHALLLTGPRGIGKRLLAELLAASVLCDAPIHGACCGKCRSCVLMRAGTHPDLLRIAPEEPGKQIKIDQIREVAEFVMRTSSVASSKVVLIDPADAMNISSANSLLKSLEEPSAHTHLILVSDAAARLLATLRSRCEQLRFRLPEPEIALDWLQLQTGARDRDALDAAGGCPLLALQLAQAGGLDQLDCVFAVLCAAAHPGAWIPALVAQWSELSLREVLGWLFVILLDFNRGAATGSCAAMRVGRVAKGSAALMGRAAPEHVSRTLRSTLGALRDTASGANPNRQLLLESLLLSWQAGFAGAPD